MTDQMPFLGRHILWVASLGPRPSAIVTMGVDSTYVRTNPRESVFVQVTASKLGAAGFESILPHFGYDISLREPLFPYPYVS